MTASASDLARVYATWSPMTPESFPHRFELNEPPTGAFHVGSIGPAQRWIVAEIERGHLSYVEFVRRGRR